jgi:hypothetical protein
VTRPLWNQQGRWALAFSCLLSLTVWSAGGAEKRPPTHQKTKAKGVLVPFYHGDPPQLAATFKVQRVFTDYQRRGFLRIGLLPFLAAEEVTIEARNPALLEAALQSLRKWAETGDRKKLVELRQVKIVFPAAAGVSLEAGKVRLADHGDWALENGVRVQSVGEAITAASAALRVSGPEAGLLRWEQDGKPRSMNLFRTDSPTPQAQPAVSFRPTPTP